MIVRVDCKSLGPGMARGKVAQASRRERVTTHETTRAPRAAADSARILPRAPDAMTARRRMDRLARVRSACANIRLMKDRIAQLENENRVLEREFAALLLREAAASHDACHDALTGLPNRTLMLDRFGQAVTFADRQRKLVAILFIDLDGFKRINDRYGHLTGDDILRRAADRVQTAIRGNDTVCRYGGDEFVVILTELEEAAACIAIADKIQRRLSRPYHAETGAIRLRCSIGTAVYPRDGIVWEALLAHADAAMYSAKPSGQGA